MSARRAGAITAPPDATQSSRSKAASGAGNRQRSNRQKGFCALAGPEPRRLRSGAMIFARLGASANGSVNASSTSFAASSGARDVGEHPPLIGHAVERLDLGCQPVGRGERRERRRRGERRLEPADARCIGLDDRLVDEEFKEHAVVRRRRARAIAVGFALECSIIRRLR